jgi:RNA polymerase sigma factor (sigma-70 family)
MPDDAADPSETAHIDPESTFSLIERARGGDEEALERLFARHLPPLQRWASGRLRKWARDLADTDDLVQDTLLKTFNRIEHFEPRRVGALQAYLRNAILNRLRDELRRKGREPVSTNLDNVDVESADSPLEKAIGREAVEVYANGCGAGDIWMTRRHNRRSQDWDPPVNLGCVGSGGTVNTGATEIAPALFENPETGQLTLFYGSNRPGPPKDFDVFASPVDEDGYFGQGVLVPEFSSAGRDTRIFIRRDGLEAFITSDRPNGQGLIDIWTSTRETLSDPWPPTSINVPSPVNGTCDDGSPWLSRDGTRLYFFSTRTAGLECGKRDIWYATRMKITRQSAIQAMVGRFNRMVARLTGEPLS